MASSNPTQQVKVCLKDDAAYKANRKPIIQQIASGNRTYVTALIDTVKATLKAKKEPAMSKFICLYFLKEAMDIKDPGLAEYLKDKLLKRLCDIAKSNPSDVLGSKAESNIVKNFYQLLLEEIYFWSEWFGKDSKGKATKFRNALDDVSRHVKMPEKVMFFKDRSKKDDKKSSESRSSKPQPEPEPAAAADKRRPSLTVPKKEEQKTNLTGRTPEGGSSKTPSTKKIVQDLQVLNEQKNFMVEVLTSDENPDPETLGAVYEQIKESDTRMQNHVQEIFNMPDFAEKENLVNKVMEGTAFTSTYLQEYKRLQNGEIGLAQFKKIILQSTVGSQESPEKPSKKEAAPPKQKKQEQIPVPPKSKFNTAQQPEKRQDFEVNFASVNVPQGQGSAGSGASPFDNFQSTPAVPQGRTSNAFDEFDSGAKIPENNANAFSSFDAAPARPSDRIQNDAFEAQNQFDAYNQGGQPNDAFNQFNTAPQQATQFEQFDQQPQNNFADFNTFQEAPKQRRFSNQPEDDFGRFDQYNKNLDPASNSQNQFQERTFAPEVVQQQDFHQEQAYQAHQQEVVHVQPSFQPKVEIPEMSALRGERKKHEEEEKTYNNNQNPYDDGGFGEDAFADFDTRNEPRDQESSGFDFDYAGGANKKKAGTPHSVASHGNIFDDPHGRRDSFRKEFGQEDHAFDTNFGQGIDENIRNSFNSNQKQQQQQQHYTPNEPETGAFGAFNQQNQNQAWANNAFDSFNKQPEPPAQNNFGGFDDFNDRSQQQRNTFESPNPPRDTMLSASQLVSNNRVQAKYGDMESERLRKERDRILSELEGVKRMYNGMKIEFDYMKSNHDTTSNDYNKVRTELDDLRRTRGQLNFSNEQLRVENEAFKKFRGTLNNENEGHLRLFEDMSKELSAIKQKVNDFDVEDQKLRNGSRLMELESSLKNAQYKIESMHNLQRTVHSEFNNVNNEFDRYRPEPAFSPRRELFGSTYSPRRDLHTIGSTSLHPVPTSLDPHKAYQSPPRQRSRSPQIVDLLSLERPHLAASRTSPNRLVRNSPPPLRSSYRAGDLLTTPFDLMNGDLPPINTISQPYRPSVGVAQGLSEYKYSDPLTTSQLNRQVSPPRYTSTLQNAEPPRSNFSNLLGFVPKYSDIPPLNPSDIVPNNLSVYNTAGNTSQTSVLNLPPFPTTTTPNPLPTYSSTLNIQTTAALGSYPNKYSQSAGLPSEQPVGFDTLKRQGVSSTMTYSVAIPQPNSASKKAVDLIEKARKMREARSGTSSIVGGDYQRDSVHNRPSAVNRNLAEDFIMPPPVIGNTNSMQQAGQFGGRLSPTRTRTSPIRANKISPRKSVSSPGRERPSNRPPVYSQEFRGRTSAMGSGPVNIQGEYAVNTRDYASIGAPTNIVTELESQIASLPEGLYRGSPIRERVVNRSEMVELKPTESLRIVERVIGKSPSQRRERSPAPKPTAATGEHHRKIFDSKPQTNQRLAETLKSDFEMIKRSIDGTGRYGIVSASLNNPPEMAETYQDKNIYGRGTSTTYVPDEMANASTMLRQYSQDQPVANKFGETLKRGDIRASGTLFRDDLRTRTSGIGGLGDTYSGKEVRQTGGAPGVKLTVEDNYFLGSTHTRGFSQDLNHARTAAITDGLINQYNLTGKKIKPKNGRRLEFDHTLFDKFSNAIYGNPYFRDIDTFKNSCLVSRANLFETHLLQISSITRNESPVGPNDEILKVIIHYANKSLMDIVDFSAYPLEHSVQYVPQIQGGALTSKYQLKQEFYVSFFDFKNSPYIVNVSYKQESSVKQMDIVLPITVNKFMKFRQGIAKNIFKDTWKQIKFGVTTTGYRNINSKFVRTHAELNKYFENNLVDISPQINAKNKKKYGGAFMLPDNKEYYLKITLDSSRLKVAVACGVGQGGYEEMIAQFLTFLLTV